MIRGHFGIVGGREWHVLRPKIKLASSRAIYSSISSVPVLRITGVPHHVLVMKEAVLDFGRRQQLRPPTWWTEDADKPIPATNKITGDVAAPKAGPNDCGQEVFDGTLP